MADPAASQRDCLLRFSIPARDARGRIVRLGPVLDDVLAAHAYPPVIAQLLAEALVLVALLGSLLKGDGSQLTMQAQTQGGVIDLLVADYRDGELRGYIQHDADRLVMLGVNPSLFALFGTAYLAITFDLAATGQRYQGIVPIEGETLAEACEHYFAQSEQLPTLIRVGVDLAQKRSVAGGLLMQHLPEGEEGRERLHVRMDHPEWQHVAALAGSTRATELADPALPLDDLLWRLFHEEDEVRIEPLLTMSKGCRCTVAHFRGVLARFGPDQLTEMEDDDGEIRVDCAFCSKQFTIDGLNSGGQTLQ